MDILENVEAVAKETLPLKGGGGSSVGRKATPGWSEFVKPYLEESKFWQHCMKLWLRPAMMPEIALFMMMNEIPNYCNSIDVK